MQILLGHCLLLLFFVLSTPFPKRFLLCISNCPQPFLYHDNVTDCGLTTELRRCADVPPFVFGCVFLCIPDNSNSVSCSCGACMLVPERGNYPFTDAMVQPCTWTGTITQYMMYGAFSFFWFRRRSLSNVDVTFSPLRPIILLSSSFFVSPPLRGKKISPLALHRASARRQPRRLLHNKSAEKLGSSVVDGATTPVTQTRVPCPQTIRQIHIHG